MEAHRFGTAETGDLDVSMVTAAEIQAVDGRTQPEVDAGDPHQDSVLEALGQVWVGGVPCSVPVLWDQMEGIRYTANHMDISVFMFNSQLNF